MLINMYGFFTIFGIIFVSIFATVTNYLYEIFPINKITNIFSPLGNGIWHKINCLIIPTIIWGFIEIPVLGNLSFFWIAILLNILIQSSIMYVIKYSAYLLNWQGNVLNLLSIYISSIIGFFLSYLIFMLSYSGNYMLISIIMLFLILAIYLILLFFPPNSEFFRGKFD